MKSIIYISNITSKPNVKPIAQPKIQPEILTDKELYNLCKKYGTEALLWRQKFIGLLPEVKRRELYLKKGFGSIHEFAAKLAGVSREHVNRVVNLEEKFSSSGTLKLHEMLVSGEVSSNKLTKVASIASVETEEELVDAVAKLPCRSVETYVRDMKNRIYGDIERYDDKCDDSQNKNGLFEGQNEGKLVHVNKKANERNEQLDEKKKELNLSEDVLNQLLELQSKGIDIDEVVRGAFKKREEELVTDKYEAAKNTESKEHTRKDEAARDGRKYVPQRYINAQTKKLLEKEHGTKCAVPTCVKDSEHIHHTARFGLTESNNPYFLAPLCKSHHDIAHMMDEKFATKKMQG